MDRRKGGRGANSQRAGPRIPRATQREGAALLSYNETLFYKINLPYCENHRIL